MMTPEDHVPEKSGVPSPPKGSPPPVDLTPSADTIMAFGKLVADGKRRYDDMLKNALMLPADREARESSFKAHYQVKPVEDKKAYEDLAVDTTSPDLAGVAYINAPDPLNREIRAYANVGPKQPPPWSLKSSDILYQQYRAAAAGKDVPLSTIRRCNVASGTGTIAMTCARHLLGDGALMRRNLSPSDTSPPVTVRFSGDRTLTASVADIFFAWLGTENGVSAIWLVRDYGERLSITGISHVVVNSVQDITIYFVPATGAEKWEFRKQ